MYVVLNTIGILNVCCMLFVWYLKEVVRQLKVVVGIEERLIMVMMVHGLRSCGAPAVSSVEQQAAQQSTQSEYTTVKKYYHQEGGYTTSYYQKQYTTHNSNN